MNGYCPVRRASSVCDSVFFSSLSLLFSGFLSIPPKLSNHGFESAWGPSHFIVFFFVEARSASRIPNCSTGCSLSLSLSLSPFSLGVSPVNRWFRKHYGVLSLHCIYTHDAIHPLAFYLLLVILEMGLVGPVHPSVAENRLGVGRIASEGASDDHIIGAIFFLHFLTAFHSPMTVHMLQLSISPARNLVLDISPMLFRVFSVLCMFYSVVRSHCMKQACTPELVSFGNSVPCPCMNSHMWMHKII